MVWAVLTDPVKLTNGDFGIYEIEGELAAQSTFKLRDVITPKQAVSVTVSELIPNQCMVWESGLPFGLFTGVRQYDLKEVYDGTDFNMRQDFSGLLARFIGRRAPDLVPSFEQFANALKKEAEALAR